MSRSQVRKPGFSLVELVIVVVIIGVIAAIAVPRISRGAKGANESAVRANLAAFRTAIDLYAAEHGGAWPGADSLEATFIDQLTNKTDSAGNVGTTAGIHIYGPYLWRIPPLPVGPYAGATRVEMQTNNPPGVNENAGLGWVFNYEIGEIIANTDDLDGKGDAYSTY